MGRKGFTVAELIMVVLLIGVIAAVGLPRLRQGLEKQNVRSAKALIASMVATARAAAVQRGCVSTLSFSPDSVWVTACGVTGNPPPASVVVGTAKHVGAQYNVTLSASQAAINYDPRGMSLLFQPTTVRVIGPQYRDSVVINELGRVKRQ